MPKLNQYIYGNKINAFVFISSLLKSTLTVLLMQRLKIYLCQKILYHAFIQYFLGIMNKDSLTVSQIHIIFLEVTKTSESGRQLCCCHMNVVELKEL